MQSAVRSVFSLSILVTFLFVGAGCERLVSNDSNQYLSESGQDAYSVLAESDFYGAYAGGFVPMPSRESKAFRTLYQESENTRISLFQRLVKQGSLAGQLYGLTGLYLTNRDLYQSLAKEYFEDTRTVRTASGCVLYDARVSELMAQIDDGSAPQDMLESGKINLTVGNS